MKASRKDFLRLLGIGATSIIISANLPNWTHQKDLEERVQLLSVNKDIEHVVRAKNMPIFLFPMYSDYFFNPDQPIKRLILGPENQVGFKGIYTLKVDDRFLRTTILHNVTSKEKVLPVAVLNERRCLSGFDQRQYYSEIQTQPIGEYTLMDEFFPNKITNLLLESIAFSEFQEKHGGFLPGKEYSLLNIVSPKWGSFKDGINDAGNSIRGEGICGGATNLAKSLVLAGARIKNWQHQEPYWIGPINPHNLTWRNSDSAVEIEPDGKRYDLTWVFPNTYEKYFLDINASVFSNNQPITLDAGGAKDEKDVRIVLNFAWTNEKPKENKIDNLNSLLDSYDEYRETGIAPQILKKSKTSSEIKADIDTDAKKIYSLMYPKDEILRFKDELENDPYISEVKLLSEIINKYADETTYEQVHAGKFPGIGTFLRQTEWYQGLGIRKIGIDKCEGVVNTTTYRDQTNREEALQCVGWVVLLAHLGYYASPRNVGAIRSSNVTNFIPEEIRNGTYIVKGKYGFVFANPSHAEDYDFEVGDLFLDQGTRDGHIGAIIGKKIINDEPVWLVTDSNRRNKGRVGIFEVDSSNYNVTLGKPDMVLARDGTKV